MNDETKPDDEFEFDRKKYYTSGEAALQALCWMHGVKRQKYVRKDDLPLKQYPYLDELNDSAHPLLERFAKAVVNHRYAADHGESIELLQKHHEEFELCREMESLHSGYSSKILDEYLENEKQSLLKFHDDESQSDVLIPRLNLHLWLCETYGVKLIGSSSAVQNSRHKGASQTQVKIDRNATNESDPDEFGERKTKNVLITLAFLAEAFAKDKPIYLNGDELNETQIAEHLRTLIDAADPEGSIPSQTIQNMRKVISLALKVKQAAILGR